MDLPCGLLSAPLPSAEEAVCGLAAGLGTAAQGVTS